MAKLLALDLDGTLLCRDGTVHPLDVAAIARAQRAGIFVTIATGRLLQGTVTAAALTGISGLVACVDGSHLATVADSKTVVRHHVAPDVVAEFAELAATRRLAAFAFFEAGIRFTSQGQPYAPYVATWSHELALATASASLVGEAFALLAIAAPNEIAALRAHFESRGGAHIVTFPVSHASAIRQGEHALLVRAAGVDKGTGLVALCDHYGVPLAESVAVGDWLNDVPMFRVAGRAFAMGGSPPEVAAVATAVLSARTTEGRGVAEVVRRVWGL